MMRVLRSRKSTSSDTGENAAAGASSTSSASPNKGQTTSTPTKAGKVTRSSSRVSASNNDEADDYAEIPLFGLSELMSGVDNQNDDAEEDDDVDTADTDGEVKAPPKRKRVRNPPREPVICQTCGKHFTRKAHLVRHEFLHTGEKPYKCSKCDQSFNRKDHLRCHIRGHAEMKEYQCNHCHCSFKRPDLLRVHVLKNHGKYQKTFKPAATSKAMPHEVDEPSQTGPRGLREKSSFGFKILTCSYCNKKFTQEHLYNAHMALHEQSQDELAVAEGALALTGEEGENSDNLDDNYDELEEENEDDLGDENGDDMGEGNEDDLEQNNLEEDSGDGEDMGMQSHIQQLLMDQLNQPRRFECVVCARVFKEQRALRRHYKLHKRNFVCRFCGIRMSSAGSLMRHNLLHTGEKPFHCELCDRRFSRKDALKSHLAAHEKESTKIQLSRPYKCKYCFARYTMRYNLIRHIRQSHPPHSRNNARLQALQRAQQQNQIRHVAVPVQNEPTDDEEPEQGEDMSTIENPLQCKHCNKVFANTKSLSTHLWYHNQEKRFNCKICKHGFKYASDLSRHYLTHNRTKKPDNATQVVVQSRNRNRPVQATQVVQHQIPPIQRAQPTHNSIMVNGQRLYPCGVCGQIFNHRSNRSRHMRLFHKGNTPATAPQQQQQQRRPQAPVPNRATQRQRFFVKAALNMRRNPNPPPATASSSRNMNQGVAPAPIATLLARQARISVDSNNDEEQPNSNGEFECEHCGKTFTKRYNYKLHMRTHNKQFACPVCGLRTASQGDLTLHIRTHTGEKPFQCSRCDWRFCRRSALTVHYRRHHGPNAKIKRHYNPQRVTPNILPVDGDDEGQLAIADSGNDVADPDNGILKTMLENSLVKQEVEDVPVQPQAKVPRKNLPPPPPLLRYPMSTPLPALRNALTVHKVELVKEEDDEDQESGDAPTTDVVFLCRPCGTLITGKDDYVRHMLQEHGTSVSVASNKQNSAQGTSTSGPPTLQQRPKLLQRPQQQQATACRQCGEMFGSKHDLTVHVLVAHSSDNSPVTCGICRKNCSTIEFLSRHYQYVHPDVKNAAEEARILLLNTTNDYDQDQDDDMYMQNSQEEATPASLLCPEVVIQEGDGEADNENNEEMYEEDYEENFPVPETILESETPNHQEQSQARQSTDPNLPYPCPICNKAFKDKKALADHKWYHSREPIHPCTICGKRFKLKNDLIRHHRRHLQERPHACHVEGCDSRFYQKLDLDRHLAKVHNQLDSVPHKCQYCPARFAQPGTLVRHMKCSHPGKDISQLLIIQMHSQKRKADDEKMQEYLSNLQGEEEEQPPVDEEMGDGNDYSFELQQLEIDMSTEEDGNEHFLQQEQEASNEQNYDDEMDMQAGDGEVLQYQEDQEEYWLQDEQNEDEMPLEGSSSSLLQPCMKKLEEYTNERGELFCKPCNKQFKDLKTLQNHVYYHQRESKHPCTHCGARFKQKSDLRRHIGIHHDPNKRRQCIPCPNCNRSFTDERYLRIHLNRNCDGTGGPNEENESEEYNQESYDLQGFESSMQDGDNDQAEEFDGEDVEQQEQEQEGWGEEPDPMMFVASALQTEADDNYGGEEYEQDEMEDGQDDNEYNQNVVGFDCDICGAIFSRTNELLLHKRSHKVTKTFPFTSTSASASAGNKKSKIFNCDKCGMSFIQKAELTQHLQTYHLDELPVYECQYCPKYFYVKKSLDTHRRRHHSHLMNLHPCKVCGAKFSQVEYLATHMKSHHSIK